MAKISYRRHRFPPAIIQHAVWLYLRSNLSYRDVEELLAERGLDISYATVRGQTRLPRYPRASRARFGQHRDPTQHEVRCLKTPLEQLAYIIEKAREFDVETPPVDAESGSNPTDDNDVAILEDTGDNPTRQELAAALDTWGDDQPIEVWH